MNYLKIENTLTNFGFYLLFFSMLFFWFQTILTKNKKLFFLGKFSLLISNLTTGCFLILRWLESKHFPLSNLYESLIFLSWGLTLVFLIISRKIEHQKTNEKYFLNTLNLNTSTNAKHYSNEVQQSNNKQNLFLTNAKHYSNQDVNQSLAETNLILLGSILTPIALLINAFASFSLPFELRQISPLVPALQSNWLMMHVSVMMLSYTALIAGCLFSIVFLILTKGKEINLDKNTIENFLNVDKIHSTKKEDAFSKTTLLNSFDSMNQKLLNQNVNENCSISLIKNELLIESKQNLLINTNSQTQANPFISVKNKIFDENLKFNEINNFEHAKTFDNLSYRTLSLGFAFLTIGILSGAVWANEAWGSYWSWDPKETWALITWIIFAIYLHTRLNRGWKGRNSAFIAVLGLIIVFICYLGINFLGKGLHSYGFFN